jgi:hypothetical protein
MCVRLAVLSCYFKCVSVNGDNFSTKILNVVFPLDNIAHKTVRPRRRDKQILHQLSVLTLHRKAFRVRLPSGLL